MEAGLLPAPLGIPTLLRASQSWQQFVEKVRPDSGRDLGGASGSVPGLEA